MKYVLFTLLTLSSLFATGQQNFAISGKLNVAQLPISQVKLFFELHDLTLDKIKTFSGQKEYKIDGLIASHDYTLSLLIEETVSDLSGTSTLDLVVVLRYLLGISYFSSNIQYIAADINNDKKVDIVDITMMRKYILGYDIDLPFGWKGVATGAKKFEYRHIILDINADIGDLDFDIIKIGDLR